MRDQHLAPHAPEASVLDAASGHSDQAGQAPHALLQNVLAQSLLPAKQAGGIAIGVLEAFDPNGRALVNIAALGLTRLSAPSLVTLDKSNLGAQLALGFESGDSLRPIILGLILAPQTLADIAEAKPAAPDEQECQHTPHSKADSEPLDLIVDGQHIVLQAEREIELRCGEAAIILSADGHIQLRGTYITSHASATQRILGGSINMN